MENNWGGVLMRGAPAFIPFAPSSVILPRDLPSCQDPKTQRSATNAACHQAQLPQHPREVQPMASDKLCPGTTQAYSADTQIMRPAHQRGP